MATLVSLAAGLAYGYAATRSVWPVMRGDALSSAIRLAFLVGNSIAFASAATMCFASVWKVSWAISVFRFAWLSRGRDMYRLSRQLTQVRFRSMVIFVLLLSAVLGAAGQFAGYWYVIGLASYPLGLLIGAMIYVTVPPGVLLLGESSQPTLETFAHMRSELPELRVVSLLDYSAGGGDVASLAQRSWLDNFRRPDPRITPWYSVMRRLLENTRLVVVDIDCHSQFVRMEALAALKSTARQPLVLLTPIVPAWRIAEYLRSLEEWASMARADPHKIFSSSEGFVDEMYRSLQELDELLRKRAGTSPGFACQIADVRRDLGRVAAQVTNYDDDLSHFRSEVSRDHLIVTATRDHLIPTIRQLIGLHPSDKQP